MSGDSLHCSQSRDSLRCSRIRFAYSSFLSVKRSLAGECPAVALDALRAERAGIAISLFLRRNVKRWLQRTARSMRHCGAMPGGQVFRLKAISSSQLITTAQTHGALSLVIILRL